jgi:NTE family protein
MLSARLATPLAAALLLALTLVAGPVPVAAQQAADRPDGTARPAGVPRPKIGLVLGGGGARGMAHIGVLKVMHELRIPVDYVTGTSMGSIVGGTFASGVGPLEMEDKVLRIDWDSVLDDRVKRENMVQRRKDDERTPLMRLEFGVRDGQLLLPAGAIYGQKLEFLLADLTATTPGERGFDKLPTPFRAVATDLETGEQVVFDQGFLRQAMRASMSVPGAFDPVEVNGRILVDGGLVNNVPIDIARGMGAEAIIAIDVGANNRKRDSLTSLPAVLDQMINISIRRNADESLATLTERDVKIVPDLGDIGSASFDRAKDAIAVGEKAARAMAAQLARYSVSPLEYEQWLDKRARERPPLPTPAFIETEGLHRVNPEVMLGMMNTKPGQPVDMHVFTDDIERLNSRGDFNGIDAIAVTDDRGTGLRVKFIEKPWGPNFFKMGLNLSSDFQGNAYYNLLARYTRTWINSLGGELRADASLGRTQRIYGELYQPLNYSGTLFVRPYTGTQRTNQPFYLRDGSQIADYAISSSYVGADIGSQFFKWGEVSTGVRYADSDATPQIGIPGVFPAFQVPYGGVTFRAIYDQLDNFFFPTDGSMVEVNGLLARSWAGSPGNSERVTFNALKAFHIGPHNFSVALEAGKLYGSDDDTYSGLFLGGLFRLSGLKTDQLYGDTIALGRVLYSYRIAKLPSLLGGNIVGGFSLEAGNAWAFGQKASASDLIYSGSIYFGADTFAGPFYLAYGQAEKGRGAFYMYLGRPF